MYNLKKVVKTIYYFSFFLIRFLYFLSFLNNPILWICLGLSRKRSLRTKRKINARAQLLD